MNIAKRHTILNVHFDALTAGETLEILLQFLQTDRNHLIVTPNPEAVMLAGQNEGFLHILQQADLVLPDGIGIIIAARLRKIPIYTRVTGCDITMNLLAQSKGSTIYLLGAAPSIADVARQNLINQGVNVVGAHDGYFNEDEEILAEIQSLNPDILIIGMGMPRQEEWAARHLHTLPCKITLCVGGTIDILAGNVQRAPIFMRKTGLEWLYRLATNPSRAKRMLNLPRFIWASLSSPKHSF